MTRNTVHAATPADVLSEIALTTAVLVTVVMGFGLVAQGIAFGYAATANAFR